MRTAAICPTCATYTNAVCVIYDGPYLSNLGINPMSSLDDALQQINSVAGMFEKTANKSTNTSLGTSNTLYPTQNAVKTYVDAAISAAPVPNLQQVTSVSNVTDLWIYSQDDVVSPNAQAVIGVDTITGAGAFLSALNLTSSIGATLYTDRLIFEGTGRRMIINTTNLTSGIKNIEIPNNDGTFALSVNGNAADTSGEITIPDPYRVYVAVISMVNGSIINLFKNTLGDTLTWTAASGTIYTSSSVLASENNVFISVTSRSVVPKIVSADYAVSSLSWNVAIYQTDNAGVPNSTDSMFVEIRIY